MFEAAIEDVSRFTRPFHFALRKADASSAIASAASLFFVNDQGDAITCRHVGEILRASAAIGPRYQTFKAAVAGLTGKAGTVRQAKKQLARQHGFHGDSVTHMIAKVMYVSPDPTLNLSHIIHPSADLEILRIKGVNPFTYAGHARFLKDSTRIKQGTQLCRIGYPFAEFTDFGYDAGTDNITWTQAGSSITPVFPIDGMVTRFLIPAIGQPPTGLELTTPGLRGMSGGPLFDADGVVFGMQSSTQHAHLDFDLDHRDVASNTQTRVFPYMHLGRCVHVDVIKAFLMQHGIPFTEV